MVKFCPFRHFHFPYYPLVFCVRVKWKGDRLLQIKWMGDVICIHFGCHKHPTFLFLCCPTDTPFHSFWKFKCQALHFDNAAGTSGIGLWIDSITPTHFIITVYLFVINPNWLRLIGRFKTYMLWKGRFLQMQFFNQGYKRPFSNLNAPSTRLFIYNYLAVTLKNTNLGFL